MTQMVFNIKDTSLIPILEGIGKRLKGVSVVINDVNKSDNSLSSKELEKRSKAIEELNKVKFDSSLIDMNDERTQYLMSK